MFDGFWNFPFFSDKEPAGKVGVSGLQIKLLTKRKRGLFSAFEINSADMKIMCISGVALRATFESKSEIRLPTPGSWVLVLAQCDQCDLHFKRNWNYWWKWRCLVRYYLFFVIIFLYWWRWWRGLVRYHLFMACIISPILCIQSVHSFIASVHFDL